MIFIVGFSSPFNRELGPVFWITAELWGELRTYRIFIKAALHTLSY